MSRQIRHWAVKISEGISHVRVQHPRVSPGAEAGFSDPGGSSNRAHKVGASIRAWL